MKNLAGSIGGWRGISYHLISLNSLHNNHKTKEVSQGIKLSLRTFWAWGKYTSCCNTKYLGVQIDGNLTCKNQIKLFTDEASRAIGFLTYAKHFLPETVLTLYTSIFEPHFQYCCSVWGCCNSTDILELQNWRGSRTEQHASWPTGILMLQANLWSKA